MSELDEIYELLATESIDLVELMNTKKKELNITSDRYLSRLLGIPKDTLKRILARGSKKVDIVSIIKIANFLQLDIDKMIQIYVSSMDAEQLAQLEENKVNNYLVRNFDLEGMYKMGFIEDKEDFKKIELRIKNFFKIDSIFQYTYDVGLPLYSKAKTNSSDRMRTMWLKCAYCQFEELDNPNEFDVDALKKIVTKVRPYTRLEKKGLITVIRALWQAGVSVIVQRYLHKTAVFGATMIVNKKPCIILTNLQNRYDLVWRTLLHEICHSIYDYEDIEKHVYHLSGEQDLLMLNEARADNFAHEMLFPKEKLDFISPHINNQFYVAKYAEDNYIHPSLIYGFHCDRFVSDYPKFRRLIPKADKAIKLLNTDVWMKTSFDSDIQLIKSKLEFINEE